MTLGSIRCLPAAVALALLTTQAFAQSTDEVLQHHLDAFGAGDVEAILSDYADDAVVINQSGVMKGRDEIKRLFDAFVEEFGQPGTTFELLVRKVDGEVAYIVWKAETADNIYEMATDTFVVRDGKIAYQTLAAKSTAK